MVVSSHRRYDIPAYTEGWFQLGWSKDLEPGELKKSRQFGKTFTMFRGEDGKVGVIDDICPHLGAHFSEGGCVDRNSVRCPYHNWAFDRHGQCTDIPYAKKIPSRATVGAHHVVERNGMIFIYRNKAGTEPTYELPEMTGFDPSQFMTPTSYDFNIRIHGQDIAENSVDSAHFQAVHGHAMPKNEFKYVGETLHVTQTTSVKRFGGTLNVVIEFNMVEPGFHYVHFPTLPGGVAAFLFSSLVPVDEDYTNHRMTLWVQKSRIPGYAQIIRRFLMWQMMKTYHEDKKIWESKEYHSRPVLCDGDAGIMKLRKWYSRFYEPTGDEAIAAE